MVAHAAPESGVSGLMMTQLGPMLISSQAIVTSENQGPVRGALMMGRLLDAEAIAELAARTRVNLKLWPIGSKEISAHDHKALAKVTSPGSTWICDEEAEYLHGYTVLRDIFEKPVILLRADLPRLIRQRGIVAAHVATASSIAGGFGILAMMWLVLRYTVINPLTAVTRHAVRVGTVGDLSVRLNMPRKDEIGILAGEFDQMVGHLAESRAQMLTVARRAGMAEVATDVLHNVGNVLNSVNVAANLVTEKLRQSEVPGLDLAAKMMIEHQQDLGRFVTEDERGKQLPNYFAELAKFLAEEQGVMLGEMKSLTASIEHIKQVINLQQAHSKTVALVENVDPVDVLEEAIRLNLDSFGRHHVKILRGFQPIGPVPLDRHKVLQTLVNLISNAKNAIKAGDNADRQILLKLERVRAENGDRLHVSVTDNGIGITPENLSKIFSFGFSSRPGGHGFGLHSAANMAREMAGNLTASSEGPGKGETFTIEVPISHHEVLR
jgi:signal transduction histidine kinase